MKLGVIIIVVAFFLRYFLIWTILKVLNLLQNCFCFMFWFWAPGIKLALPALAGKVLTTGLPGKSLVWLFYREHRGSERLRKLPKVTQSANGESRLEPVHFESTFEPYPRSQSRKGQSQDISPGRSIWSKLWFFQ